MDFKTAKENMSTVFLNTRQAFTFATLPSVAAIVLLL